MGNKQAENKKNVGDEVFVPDRSRSTGATHPLKKGAKKGNQRKRALNPSLPKKKGMAALFLGT